MPRNSFYDGNAGDTIAIDNSAAAASASETAAAASEAAAAISETNAAASYDSFDDRYLGVKSSGPTLDNDGDALVDGALYFDTTTNTMMVYDLGGTTWNRTTPTTSDQTKINTVSGIAANVTTVAGISANVTTVAGISSDVTTVAGKATEIGRLGTADAVADMAILGTTDIVADMAILGTAAVVSDLNTLGTADVVSDLNTLGTADVVTDMNLLATSGNVTNMATLGASGVVSNISTVAGVAANVTTVAGNASNITTVAGVSTDVTTCATNVTAIQDAPDYATDAYNWATRAEDSSHTDSTARTGYSAYHYSEKADASADRAAAWVIEGESAVYAVSTPTDFGSVTDVGSAVFEGESTTSIQLTMSRGSSTYDYGTV